MRDKINEGTTGGPGLYVLAYARADLLDFASKCSSAASAFKASVRASSFSRFEDYSAKVWERMYYDLQAYVFHRSTGEVGVPNRTKLSLALKASPCVHR